MQQQVEIFENFLRTKNLKHSKPRFDILAVFLASQGHFSAQELYDQVRQKHPRIGFATVHRTLKLLEDCGLARSVNYGDGTQRYEPNRFQHHHVICTSCNRTVEFLSPELESLLLQVQQNHDFMPQLYEVHILSVCTDCNKATPPSSRHVTAADLETILSRDALEVAVANEQQGLLFYNHALEVTTDEITRTIFARLADEEQRHLEVLQQEYDTLRRTYRWLDDEPSLLHFDHERLDGIFPKGRDTIGQMVRSAGPAEALRLAMDAERRSYEFFQHYADKVDYPKGREIFAQFAQEEQQHLTLIYDAYNQLQTQGES